MIKGFDEIFASTSERPIQYGDKLIERMDVIPVGNESQIELNFISVNSNWRQGVVLETKGTFIVNGQKLDKKIVLWQDTAPQNVQILIKSKNKELLIYNVWDTGNGSIDSWHNGAAFFKTVKENVREYYCNDGYPDDDFDDLVFNVKII